MTDKEKIKQLELELSNYHNRVVMLRTYHEDACVLNNELTAILTIMAKYFRLIDKDEREKREKE